MYSILLIIKSYLLLMIMLKNAKFPKQLLPELAKLNALEQ